MEGLGIDPIQLGAQIINVVIMIFVLKYFLYTPILSMVEKRKKEIEEGLALKEKALAEKEKLSSMEKKIRKQVKDEERRVMKEVVLEAKKKENSIIEEAKKEIQKEREKMLEELSREREKILDHAKKQSLRYAIQIAEKVLGEKLNAKEQEKLLQKALSQLNN